MSISITASADRLRPRRPAAGQKGQAMNSDTKRKKAERLLDEAQNLQLESLIQLEISNMLIAAGFSPDANLMNSVAALGGWDKVSQAARARVLERLSWQP